MSDKTVFLTVDQSGYGGLQMSINVEDKTGGGHGYRLHGPKYCNNSNEASRMTDTMTDWLCLIRASWLSGIPCHELLAASQIEWHRDLILHEYAKLGWAEWSANSTNKAYS